MTSLLEQGVRKETERMQIQKCIIAFVGPPLMGKSTLGRELAQATNATFLDMDEIRWKIFPRTERLSNLEEMFSIQTSYQRTHEIARNLLGDNKPVIVAAAYSRQLYHEMLSELAQKASAPLVVFNPRAPFAEIEKRSADRQKNGNASTTTTIDQFLKDQDRYSLPPNVRIHAIDSTRPVEENVVFMLHILQELQS